MILAREFYNRSPLLVGPDLLGKILVRKYINEVLSGRIVEVEAYTGLDDEAAHSYRGKTKRNASLFGHPGYTYVHKIHMQNCIDIVTEEEKIPSSVLIRALEPISGIETMKKLRARNSLKELTSGPGKLCQALNITRDLDGMDVTNNNSKIYIYSDNYLVDKISESKRVGLKKAKELEYRFYIKDNIYISKK